MRAGKFYLNAVDNLYATAGVDFRNIAGVKPAFVIHGFLGISLVLNMPS